jgi:hypothetical protein
MVVLRMTDQVAESHPGCPGYEGYSAAAVMIELGL